jgi:hypothetical protein
MNLGRHQCTRMIAIALGLGSGRVGAFDPKTSLLQDVRMSMPMKVKSLQISFGWTLMDGR